jgi:methylglutaconyl-CoA hydratase
VLAKIGSGHARALFATGEPFDAYRAERIGLVHEVTEDLDDAVRRKLSAVLAAGPKAVHAAKQLAQNPPLGPSDSAKLLARVRATEEAREGLSAFLEKRPASYVVKL